LSKEKVCDEGGEGQELGYEARLLEDQAPAYVHRAFLEHIFQDLQRKSAESDTPNLPLLVGGLRQSGDGVEAVNDTKPELNVASSEGGETEMRDSESLLSIFLEEQVTRASSAEPILEGWIPIPQKPAPAAAVLRPEEGVPDAAAPAPEGAAVAAAVPFRGEDVPVASVATIEARVPVASVVTVEKDMLAAAPAVAVPASEGTAPAAAVTIMEEDAPAVAEPTTRDDIPEGSVTPAATVPTPEEPAAPAVRAPTPEEPVTPADRALTPEEPVTPAVRAPTPEEPAGPAVRVPTPEEPVTPASAVPAVEEVFPAGVPFLGDAAHTDSVPISEEETSVLEEASPARMWIKEDLDSPGFGIKEVTGTVRHGKVPLAATDGLNSNEMFQKEQVDPLQMKLQQVNGLGQGLIQSAGKKL